jgi:tungstate transport system substrate-binding protein
LVELKLWNKDVGINIEAERGAWYKPVERGMKATLHMALVSGGYTLSDRGTWISFKNKHKNENDLEEGDKRLFNQYGVMLVNPAKHPSVKKDLGQQFIDYSTPEARRPSPATRSMASSCYPNAEDQTREFNTGPLSAWVKSGHVRCS